LPLKKTKTKNFNVPESSGNSAHTHTHTHTHTHSIYVNSETEPGAYMECFVVNQPYVGRTLAVATNKFD